MKNIVLASSSPRRQEILSLAGLPFIIGKVNYVEDHSLSADPSELVQLLAREKAVSCSHNHPDSLIIAVDQVAVLDGEIIGKPHTTDRHRDVLHKLQGRTHEVVTGYIILDTKNGDSHVDVIVSKVLFRPLTGVEIDSYVSCGEGLDRAGGYAIQGRGAVLIDSIIGDYYSIVGLPLSRVVHSLRRFGVDTLK